MRRVPRVHPLAAAMAGGLVLGLGLYAAGVAEEGRAVAAGVVSAPRIDRLDPVSALPRTTMFIALEEARYHFAGDRPWAAWTALRPHMLKPESAPAPAVLVAARAAAEWGGWDQVERLLEGQPWLDDEGAGEGWYLLGRSAEESEQWTEAAAAFRRAAAAARGGGGARAQLRLGRVLRESGDLRGAAAAFQAAAVHMPEIEEWLRALQVEALAGARDPAALTVPGTTYGGSAPARMRRARAEALAHAAADAADPALERLEREERLLAAQRAPAEAAALAAVRADLLASAGRTWDAREVLRAVASDPAALTETRLQAARRLAEVGQPLLPSEEAARAAAFEAAGRHLAAARSLRAARQASGVADGATDLQVGHLFFRATEWRAARDAFVSAAERLTEPEARAEALLFAARARFRIGERAPGLADIRGVAERFPSTPAGGSAWFILADEAKTNEAAIPLYRRAAAATGSADAAEALERLADRLERTRDRAGAMRAWTQYVERYPRGPRTAAIAYRTGVLHERANASEAAARMYRAAMAADPLSYEALRAAERLGVDPFGTALDQPHPWIGLATDPVDARAALVRLDRLEEGGLGAEWEEELRAAIRRFERRPAGMIVLAEGLRDRGHVVEAVRIGRRLSEERDGQWDERLLKVVFPLPYRDLLLAESRRAGIDPMLFAGLVRQESMFRPAARSRVGATGLAQIMPATGRWLAPAIRLEGYEDRLLTVPEVNLRMGAKYLGDLLGRYDGARDLALAGYNAGPGRADRWRRELGHGRDTDAFRDAIPFDETRHYVRVVLRNAFVYERLYGDGRHTGLVGAE
jgi:soluble lytic murein transglycosylase